MPNVRFLAVKRVCDKGDVWKADLFHKIAAENAAAWLRYFIHEQVVCMNPAKVVQRTNDSQDDIRERQIFEEACRKKVTPYVDQLFKLHNQLIELEEDPHVGNIELARTETSEVHEAKKRYDDLEQQLAIAKKLSIFS